MPMMNSTINVSINEVAVRGAEIRSAGGEPDAVRGAAMVRLSRQSGGIATKFWHVGRVSDVSRIIYIRLDFCPAQIQSPGRSFEERPARQKQRRPNGTLSGMDQPAVIRRVRIAVSVFFGVLTVALAVLWVRSYWHVDQLEWFLRYFSGTSMRGGIGLIIGPVPKNEVPEFRYWTSRIEEVQFPKNYIQPMFYFEVVSSPNPCVVIGFPDWLVVIAAGLLATTPWTKCIWRTIPSRFSLRTLLIATTLAAVVLGLAVWAVR